MRKPRTEPYTASELRSMFSDGDSVATICARAYRLDRAMTKDRVRAILFDQVPA
jgi:hypothetical protein